MDPMFTPMWPILMKLSYYYLISPLVDSKHNSNNSYTRVNQSLLRSDLLCNVKSLKCVSSVGSIYSSHCIQHIRRSKQTQSMF